MASVSNSFEVDSVQNEKNMLEGKLYYAFDPPLVAKRARCKYACRLFNSGIEVSRRRKVQLWNQITQDQTPLPHQLVDEDLDQESDSNEAGPISGLPTDEILLASYPWVEPPINIDYGTNFHLGRSVFINFNCTVLDTCAITIGDRTVVGPNVSFYAATHPIDPGLRAGTKGPELGKEISVGEDCWIGGGVTVMPGVKIGKGSTVGAGSVVTKDVDEYSVVAGVPAKLLRRLKEEEMTEPHGKLPIRSRKEIVSGGQESAGK